MDFFFFKQKTAYDMRISDWSSDVCSSDLRIGPCAHGCASGARVYDRGADIADVPDFLTISKDQRFQRCFRCAIGPPIGAGILSNAGSEGDKTRIRSEEHTSELQSLMRISYARFGLKQKT